MTDQDRIDRGARIERLLVDKDFTQAFEDVRQAIYAKIEETPVRDVDGLQQLRLMLKLLRDVRANLDSAIRDGKLIKATIAEEEKRRLLKFKFGR